LHLILSLENPSPYIFQKMSFCINAICSDSKLAVVCDPDATIAELCNKIKESYVAQHKKVIFV
jgi:hypothetical protein